MEMEMDNDQWIQIIPLSIVNYQLMLSIESNTENADSSLLNGSYGYIIRRT